MVISLDSVAIIVAIVGGISALVWEYFRVILKLEEGIRDSADSIRKEINENQKELNVTLAEINSRISNQESRLARLETKMGVFWSAVGGAMSSLIKQPIHFRKDELMDKLVPEDFSGLPTCSVDELVELKSILDDELVTLRQTKDPKCLAYALAVGYINQILMDRGQYK